MITPRFYSANTPFVVLLCFAKLRRFILELSECKARKYFLVLGVFFLATTVYGQHRDYITVEQSFEFMGSPFAVSLVTLNPELGYEYLAQAGIEVKRIEKLISALDKDSETSAININAGNRPVQVSQELFGLIQRSKQVSDITEGAFDISCGTMDSIWKYDGTVVKMPKSYDVQNAQEYVGYNNIVMDTVNTAVFLAHEDMRISFGAIAKGYAADKVKELLKSRDVIAGVVDASGDITTWGKKVNGERWLVGVSSPRNADEVLSWVPLEDSSVGKAGNSEKFLTINGTRYADTINPKTGYPISNIQTVLVFSKSAERSDALATAVMVLGNVEGMELINSLEDTEVVIVDINNVLLASSGLKLAEMP